MVQYLSMYLAFKPTYGLFHYHQVILRKCACISVFNNVLTDQSAIIDKLVLVFSYMYSKMAALLMLEQGNLEEVILQQVLCH